MKLLAILLLAATSMFRLEIKGDSLYIHNNIDKPITCYVSYNNGYVSKVYVQARGVSISVRRAGLLEVECF